MKQREPSSVADDAVKVLTMLCKWFLSKPERMKISVYQPTTQGLELRATPDPVDVSRMVGTRGIMCNSLSLLLDQVGRRAGIMVRLRVLDSGLFKPHIQKEFTPDKRWRQGEIEGVMKELCRYLFQFNVEIRFLHLPDKTKVELELDPQEPTGFEFVLKTGLSKVFHAIGKANGRLIYVDRVYRRGMEGI
jgi:predicted RNA-binding protein YlqC (UPF0109 family)